jgi:hypothetical protein
MPWTKNEMVRPGMAEEGLDDKGFINKSHAVVEEVIKSARPSRECALTQINAPTLSTDNMTL